MLVLWLAALLSQCRSLPVTLFVGGPSSVDNVTCGSSWGSACRSLPYAVLQQAPALVQWQQNRRLEVLLATQTSDPSDLHCSLIVPSSFGQLSIACAEAPRGEVSVVTNRSLPVRSTAVTSLLPACSIKCLVLPFLAVLNSRVTLHGVSVRLVAPSPPASSMTDPKVLWGTWARSTVSPYILAGRDLEPRFTHGGLILVEGDAAFLNLSQSALLGPYPEHLFTTLPLKSDSTVVYPSHPGFQVGPRYMMRSFSLLGGALTVIGGSAAVSGSILSNFSADFGGLVGHSGGVAADYSKSSRSCENEQNCWPPGPPNGGLAYDKPWVSPNSTVTLTHCFLSSSSATSGASIFSTLAHIALQAVHVSASEVSRESTGDAGGGAFFNNQGSIHFHLSAVQLSASAFYNHHGTGIYMYYSYFEDTLLKDLRFEGINQPGIAVTELVQQNITFQGLTCRFMSEVCVYAFKWNVGGVDGTSYWKKSWNFSLPTHIAHDDLLCADNTVPFRDVSVGRYLGSYNTYFRGSACLYYKPWEVIDCCETSHRQAPFWTLSITNSLLARNAFLVPHLTAQNRHQFSLNSEPSFGASVVFAMGFAFSFLNNVVANNSGGNLGAVLVFDSVSVRVRGNSFNGNRNSGKGGGLYVWASKDAVVVDNTFVDNWGGGRGAAVNLVATRSLVQNNSFSGGYGSRGGAAVFVSDVSLRDDFPFGFRKQITCGAGGGDNANVFLYCHSGVFTRVGSALWGAGVVGSCAQPAFPDRTFAVSNPKTTVDVAATVGQLCLGKSECVFSPRWYDPGYGDPAPGNYKYSGVQLEGCPPDPRVKPQLFPGLGFSASSAEPLEFFNVIISDNAFTDNAAEQGSAVYVGATTVLDTYAFAGYPSAAAGGPPAPRVLLTRNVFSQNSAVGAGGAVYGETAGWLVVRDNVFIENSVSGGGGGDVCLGPSCLSALLARNTHTRTRSGSGAVAVEEAASPTLRRTLLLTDSLFSGCEAFPNGQASLFLATSSAPLTITVSRTKFLQPSLPPLRTAPSSAFSFAVLAGVQDACNVSLSDLHISNVLIDSGHGGVYVARAGTFYARNLTLTGLTSVSGGGYGPLTCADCSNIDVAGVLIENSGRHLGDSGFSLSQAFSPSARLLSVVNVLVRNASSATSAGAGRIRLACNAVTLQGITAEGVSATVDGGGLHISKAPGFSPLLPTVLRGFVCLGGCSALRGGAIFLEDNDGLATFILAGLTLSGSAEQGGALFASAGAVILLGSQLSGAAGSDGGCIYTLSGFFYIVNSSLSACTAGGNGGAVAIGLPVATTGPRASPTLVCLPTSFITKNSAGMNGGAFFAEAGGRFQVAAQCILSDNSCLGNGGAVALSGASLSLYPGASLENNRAAVVGGGVYACQSSLVFASSPAPCTASQLTPPALQQAPPGVLSYLLSSCQGALLQPPPASRTQQEEQLRGPTAREGRISRALPSAPPQRSILLARNTAQQGGAVYLSNSNLLSSGGAVLIVRGNVGTFSGGGIVATQRAMLLLQGAHLLGNAAPQGGGGGLHLTIESVAVLYACFLGENRASTGGGGAVLASESLLLSSYTAYTANSVSGAASASGGALQCSAIDLRYTPSLLQARMVALGAAAVEAGALAFPFTLPPAVLEALASSPLAQAPTAAAAAAAVAAAAAAFSGGPATATSTAVTATALVSIGDAFQLNSAPRGSAVYVRGAPLLLTRGLAFGNTAFGGSGALFCSTGVSGLLLHSNFTNNSALHSGGAVFSSEITGLQIEGCRFMDNVARGGDGGAVAVANVAAKSGAIMSGSAEDGTSSGRVPVHLSKSSFAQNYAPKGRGGAMFVDAEAHFTLSTPSLVTTSSNGAFASTSEMLRVRTNLTDIFYATMCPLGWVSPPGVGTCLRCAPGTFSRIAGEKITKDCHPCPSGGYCPGADVVLPLAGFYPAKFLLNDIVYVPCPVPRACPGVSVAPCSSADLAFLFTPASSSISSSSGGGGRRLYSTSSEPFPASFNSTLIFQYTPGLCASVPPTMATYTLKSCTEGFRDFACSACTPGWGKTGVDCGKCRPKTTVALLQVGAAVGNLAIVAYMTKNGVSELTELAAKSKEQREGSGLTPAKIKILLGTLQITSFVISLNIPWDPKLLDFFSGSKSATSAVGFTSGADCLLDSSEDPFVLLTYGLTISLIYPFFTMCLWAACIWGVIFPLYGGAWSEEEQRTKPMEWLILASIVTLFDTYPTVLQAVFSVFNCSEIGDGVIRLSSDLNLPCFQPLHLSYIFRYALPGLAVYVVGVPLLFFLLIRANRHSLDDPRSIKLVGFLTVGYERTSPAVFWEVVLMSRKAALFAVLVFFRNSGPALQASLACGLMLIFLGAHISFWPFDDDSLDSLEFAAVCLAALTLHLSTYLSAGLSTLPSLTITVLIFFLYALFFGYWLYVFDIKAFVLEKLAFLRNLCARSRPGEAEKVLTRKDERQKLVGGAGKG
jgi:hypothetical protein